MTADPPPNRLQRRQDRHARRVAEVQYGWGVWTEDDRHFYALSERQQRAVAALLYVAPDCDPPTYEEAARQIGLKRDTLRTHLRRVRTKDPTFFARIASTRAGQLADYHARTAITRRERSRRWGWYRYVARYQAAHGLKPWHALAGDAP